ncbi:hypothetical protein GCM10010349_40630 [Streptomyces flavofungini]|nr:hypothetical protein GCM10010349_40630 [Streptomyces flavofungini]
MTVRVVVVDDQAVVRAGFAAVIDAEPDLTVAGQAADGAEALELVRSCRPDVVLMDIRMPGMDGLTATRLLTEPTRVKQEARVNRVNQANRADRPDPADPPPRVLVLTTFRRDEYVFAALRGGASASCSRTANPRNSSTPSARSPPVRRCSPPRSPAASSTPSPPAPSSRGRAPTAASTSSPRGSGTSCGRWPAASATPRSPKPSASAAPP